MALKPNKIEYGGRTLIDLTGDNVIADALVEGYSAHDKSGEPINGTNPYEKTDTDAEVNSQAAKIAQLSALLDEKAVGSGMELKTCTIRLINNLNIDLSDFLYFTSVDNNGNIFASYSGEILSGNTLTMSGVLCNSVIWFNYSVVFNYGAYFTIDGTHYTGETLQAPSNTMGVLEISLSEP